MYKFKNENSSKFFEDYLKPAEKYQKIKRRSKLDFNKIRLKWEHKSEEQKSLMKNVKVFYEAKEKVVELFREYYFLLSEAKQKAK